MRKGLIIILGSAAMWSACSSAPQQAAEQTATAQQPAQTAAEAPKPAEAKPAAAAAPNAPAQAPSNTTDAPAAETTAPTKPMLPPGKQPMGALSKAEIQGVIRANNKQIRYCYEKELAKNPSLAGMVKARFTIAADGTVAAAKVGESTLDSPEVEDCLIDHIQSWIFPKPRGGVVIVNYPFKFTSQ